MDEAAAVNDLRLAASLAAFETNTLATFRDTLAKSLQTAIEASRQQQHGQDGDLDHYDAQLFERILYVGIPWFELLAACRRRRGETRLTTTPSSSAAAIPPDSKTTALEEVISLVMNPCLVSYALSSSIAMVLFRVLVEDSAAARSSTSESPLLQTLKQLLQTRPSTRPCVGSKWYAYIQSSVQLQVDSTVGSFDVERANGCVSVCKHLVRYMDGATLIKCLLTLLGSIDNADVKLLEAARGRKRRDKSTSCGCSKTNNMKARRTRNVRVYQELDRDYEDERDEASGFTVSTVEVAGGGLVERISRASQHYSRPCVACNVCRVEKASQGITQLPIQLVLLRSRIYNKVLSIFGTASIDHAQYELQRGTDDRPNALLSSVVSYACRHQKTSSFRVCVVLLVDSLSCRGYTDVIRILWLLFHQKQERQTNFGEAQLRTYAEMLAECSYFDHADKFWHALQPLLHHVTNLCGSVSSSNEEEVNSKSSVSGASRLALRCLSFILRRRRIPPSFETNPRWQEFVLRISLSFESEEWWLSCDMSRKESEETLSTLQAVGIFGFLVSDTPWAGKTEGERTRHEWPFPKSASLRAAHRRMGPNLGRHGLLSLPSHRTLAECSTSLPLRKASVDDRAIATPIMNYLHDDLLVTIFSFLGYKRLVKASGICKAWKSLIEQDDLWRAAYVARFPLLNEEKPLVPTVTPRDSRLGQWKTLMTNKVLAERSLKFKRHSSGWKHRTCGHIGCLMILKSPHQLKTHYRMHKSRNQKRSKTSSVSKRNSSQAKSVLGGTAPKRQCNDEMRATTRVVSPC